MVEEAGTADTDWLEWWERANWDDVPSADRQAIVDEVKRRKTGRRRMSELLHSSVAECALLSGILHDPVIRLDEVREQLPEGGFYFEQHAAAYEVLLNMHEARIPIEPRAFTIRCGDLGKTAVIGEATINEIIAHRPTDLHFRQYLHTCKEKRAMREMLAFFDWGRSQLYEPGNDPAALVELMQVRAMGISLDHNKRDPRHISAVLDEIDVDIAEALALADSGRKIRGMQTGLVRIDQTLGGIERGDRYLVVGLSNVGKTWRALQMVKWAVNQGERVLIFMRDGKDKEHIIRLYADMAGVELGFILGGNQQGNERTIRLEKLRRRKPSSRRWASSSTTPPTPSRSKTPSSAAW